MRRDVVEPSLYFFFFSPKAEPLQDERVGTERRKEGGVEDLLRGCSAMRKLERASETLRTHAHSCITVRVCVCVCRSVGTVQSGGRGPTGNKIYISRAAELL